MAMDPGVITWDRFREELRSQFLPANSVEQVRSTLMRLWHLGPIREYIRAFSALMLEILDMSEVDQLFLILHYLQSLVQQEVRR